MLLSAARSLLSIGRQGLVAGLLLASPIALPGATAAVQSGDRLELAPGTTVAVPWQRDGDALAVADTAAWQWLGLELLATTEPQVQPVRWFGAIWQLPTSQEGPYRYLNIEPILERLGSQPKFGRDRAAKLALPASQIRDIRLGRQDWGWRIVLELDRPTLWQQRATRETAEIRLPATLAPAARARVASWASGGADAASPQVTATADPEGVQIALRLPPGMGLRTTTLAAPPRLLLDLRADAPIEREIQWRAGIRWQQRYLALDGDRVFASWLEIDPTRARGLRPFWAGERPPEAAAAQLPGLEPLRAMARRRALTVAINGGYFNRNNQFPLGAIRRDGRWVSSPILNRGVVAWGDRGKFWFGRGRFFEVFATANGRRWPSIVLNSGYVRSGLARYGPVWGETYTPASDGETIATVGGDRVLQRSAAVPAGSQAVAIPRDGYLLVLRDAPQAAAALVPGTKVAVERGTVPAALNAFPQVVGAGPLLLRDGRVVLDAAAEEFSPAFARQRAARSAIARDTDGNLLLVNFGSYPGSKGVTLGEAARLLQLLGARDALNLDGGSSASLYLGGELVGGPPGTAARVHNGLGF